jgi:hypothetical protein
MSSAIKVVRTDAPTGSNNNINNNNDPTIHIFRQQVLSIDPTIKMFNECTNNTSDTDDHYNETTVTVQYNGMKNKVVN